MQRLWLALCEVDEKNGREQGGRSGIESETKGPGHVIASATVTLLRALHKSTPFTTRTQWICIC